LTCETDPVAAAEVLAANAMARQDQAYIASQIMGWLDLLSYPEVKGDNPLVAYPDDVNYFAHILIRAVSFGVGQPWLDRALFTLRDLLHKHHGINAGNWRSELRACHDHADDPTREFMARIWS
jgi:hypothetical protein